MTARLTRRDFLAGSAAAVAATPVRSDDDIPLRARAAKRGLLYGSAFQSPHLQDEPYAQAIAREAGILSPEYEMKADALWPAPDRFDFSGAEQMLAFAAQHGMKMRGHPLLWFAANPPWLMAKLAETRPSEKILTDYIAKVAGYFRGRIHSWDVVNEVIEPAEGHPEGLRVQSPWYKAFGASHIDNAFYAAREADPGALLFINEYFVEDASWSNARRRQSILRLCEKLKAKRVPIDGLGIQGHLKRYHEPFDEKIFARFLADARSLGLKIMVTEHDVADIGGPADIVRRDIEVANLTRRFMDVVLDCPATIGFLTWGLSDRYSWLSHPVWGKGYTWPDGQLSRVLPLDSNLQRKPMYGAIAKAFG